MKLICGHESMHKRTLHELYWCSWCDDYVLSEAAINRERKAAHDEEQLNDIIKDW